METTPEIAEAAAALVRVGAIELRSHAQTYRDIEELDAAQRCLLLAQATEEAATLLRQRHAPKPHWWILAGGFFAKGGTKFSGPYLVENDAYTARRSLEDALGHNQLFIDVDPQPQDRPAGVEE